MRSNPEERDSWNVHRARGTASDERDSHPRWCSFPRGLHLRLRWWYISRLQFKTTGPNFHTEPFPVHSPLLKESYLVSYPPLTYMLKFSGFADLASCREGCARAQLNDKVSLVAPKAVGQVSLASCLVARATQQNQLRQHKRQRVRLTGVMAPKDTALQLAHRNGHEQRAWMWSRH